MRKSYYLIIFTALLFAFDGLLFFHLRQGREQMQFDIADMHVVVRALGCSDLAISTEARYTRHPAVSDSVAPFMDHPADIEHFPTGSFWYPVN